MLIDAVGVSESTKTIAPPLERVPKVGFDKLLERIAQGSSDADTVSTMAVRLAALERKLPAADLARIAEATRGRSLHGHVDPDSLPPPDEVAAEIVESLETALEKFRGVQAALARSATR